MSVSETLVVEPGESETAGAVEPPAPRWSAHPGLLAELAKIGAARHNVEAARLEVQRQHEELVDMEELFARGMRGCRAARRPRCLSVPGDGRWPSLALPGPVAPLFDGPSAPRRLEQAPLEPMTPMLQLVPVDERLAASVVPQGLLAALRAWWRSRHPVALVPPDAPPPGATAPRDPAVAYYDRPFEVARRGPTPGQGVDWSRFAARGLLR